jgi:tetratricopeptide (TPR) repeat protein
MKPFWVTFYSYKGGVGRSLALANTAALLVKQGRRVVLIDFDLEAPGLDSFSELAPAAAGKPGVVEYVSEFFQHKVAPEITSFVHKCTLPGPLRGELWIMSAGKRDAAYNQKLTRIKWSELYESGYGTAFFENWKAAINRRFKPDFVFVDSRTGLTEVGGVCTTQFPDLVVMLFGLNEQNVKGIGCVAEHIRDADPTRVPQIHYVATPVPNLTPDKRSELTVRLNAAARHLGVKIESTIRYYSSAALSEKLFTLGETTPLPQIVADYKDLLEDIIEFNRGGLDFLMKQFTEAHKASDSDRIEKLRGIVERDFSDRPEGQYLLSQIAATQRDFSKAIELAEKSCSSDPAYELPFKFLSSYYSRSKRPEQVVALCDRLLQNDGSLSEERLVNVHSERGEKALASGDAAKAEESYRYCLRRAEKEGYPPAARMPYAFNAAEAHRRATAEILESEWAGVLNVFEQSGTTSDAALPLQANRWQAVHIGFACTGNIIAAREALQKAKRAAMAVGELEDLFSVKCYRHVAGTEFLSINDEMLAALDRGELWDGMKLPAPTK